MTRNQFYAFGLFVILIGLLCATRFGLYPRQFDISWKEEIQLHDGQTMWIDVKQTYERRGLRLSRYEDATLRRTELGFDAGGGHRVVFGSRLGLRLLDRVNKSWYVVLWGQGPYGNHPDEMPSHWGEDYSIKEERIAKFDGSNFVPISWDDAPPGAITRTNLGPRILSVEKLAEFDGKRISLKHKEAIRGGGPSGSPGGGQIARPIRMQPIKEAPK